jgi:hypothetical protein
MSKQHKSISTWFGYDPAIVAAMPPREQRRLRQLATFSLLPVLVMGLSAGAAAWLVEHSLLVSLLVALFVAIIVVNLLRLVNAGGGAAPHFSEAALGRWAPKPGPLLAIALMAAFFAQPLLVLWHHSAQEPAIAAYRQQLIAAEQASLRDVSTRETNSRYRERINQCDFAARRLALLWRSFEGPLGLTAAFCLLLCAPLLLGHLSHLTVLRCYERLRWRAARDRLVQVERATQAAVGKALMQCSSLPPEARDGLLLNEAAP